MNFKQFIKKGKKQSETLKTGLLNIRTGHVDVIKVPSKTYMYHLGNCPVQKAKSGMHDDEYHINIILGTGCDVDREWMTQYDLLKMKF